MTTAYDIKGGGEFFDMSYHILGLRRLKESGLVHVRTLKVKFQHLGEPDTDTYLAWNFNNGRYECVDRNPEEYQFRKFNDWDNSCILTSNEPDKQSNVFDSVSYDDFDNSPFEGNGINVNF